MTDKREPYTIRGAKLYFEPVRRYPADARTLRNYQMSGKLAEQVYEQWLDANFILRVISITGYNPQMLLPAPSFEREFMQTIAEWAAEQIKLPYTEFAQSVFNTLTRDGEVTFSPTGRYIDPVKMTHHWRDRGPGLKADEAPILIVQGTDFADVERKVLNYMHATFIHESALGDRVPRGKIELFDYDDHTVISLEGSGELPGRRDLVDDLFSGQFARQLGKTASMTAMMRKLERRPAPQKSYLDHDPTKRHKRRKKK